MIPLLIGLQCEQRIAHESTNELGRLASWSAFSLAFWDTVCKSNFDQCLFFVSNNCVKGGGANSLNIDILWNSNTLGSDQCVRVSDQCVSGCLGASNVLGNLDKQTPLWFTQQWMGPPSGVLSTFHTATSV